jgi:hypothetical protein
MMKSGVKIRFAAAGLMLLSGQATYGASINLDGDYLFARWSGSGDNAVVYAPAGADQNNQMNIGFTYGGHMEAYSAAHTTQPGGYAFVYGGSGAASTDGQIRFINYDGSAWTDRVVIKNTGAMGIGLGHGIDPCGDCMLDVNGKIKTKEVVVTNTGWADYVFEKDYKLMPLTEVKRYIDENGHLPGVPNAAEVEEKGINVSDISRVLLEKVEELTLHMIELKRENEALKLSIAKMPSE